jgi:hypothetical protein
MAKIKHLLLILVLTATGSCVNINAQDVAVKSNLLSDALLNVNLGMEFGLSPRFTLDVSGEFNGWTLSDERRWKHWAIQPELRYWFCDRFAGHFIGLHLHGGQYNIGNFQFEYNFLGTDMRKLEHLRYQGWFVGGGIAYGYTWILGRHWNFEAEIGVGYSYTRFDSFRCRTCQKQVGSDETHHYIGPTKAALNLVYLF